MQLKEARRYKAELLARTQTAFESVQLRMADQRRASAPTIALGLAPKRGDREFKVAVRVPPNTPAQMVRSILGRPHPDEVEVVEGVRYLPRGTYWPGCSLGHPAITAGTLGAFVQDASGIYLLSNNHVIANSDYASAGDPTWFPGPIDVPGGTNAAVVGKLARWIPLQSGRSDVIDAAISKAETPIDKKRARWYVGIGQLDPRPVTDHLSVRRVIKRGRTTGVTRGRVTAQELDAVTMDYSPNGHRFSVVFNGLVEITHPWRKRVFSKGGDSGSLILDAETLRPFALLFAGGPSADGRDLTLAHYMPEVLRQLKVGMV